VRQAIPAGAGHILAIQPHNIHAFKLHIFDMQGEIQTTLYIAVGSKQPPIQKQHAPKDPAFFSASSPEAFASAPLCPIHMAEMLIVLYWRLISDGYRMRFLDTFCVYDRAVVNPVPSV
jgi:hypothetical protein